MNKKSNRKLAGLNPGEEGIVREIRGGKGVRKNLENLGVREGSKIKVISRHFGGGPVVILAGSTRVALGAGMAGKVMVGSL
jgi:ferrous iron transport protein A